MVTGPVRGAPDSGEGTFGFGFQGERLFRVLKTTSTRRECGAQTRNSDSPRERIAPMKEGEGI